jgi:hypothetical protein
MSDRPGILPFRYSSLCLAYTTCASVLFLFAPLVTPDTGPSDRRISLFQSNGWGAVLLFALPVAFAVVPVIRRRSPHVRTLSVASAVLLGTYALLGIATIGLYYLPSVALMVAAAIREPRTPRGPVGGYRSQPADPADPPAPPAPPPPSLNGHGAG